MTSRDMILIVDDIKTNRDLLGEMFREQYDLLEAESSKAAIGIIGEYKHSIAAILYNIEIKENDGFDVLDFMKVHGYMETIPVILTASDSSAIDEEHGYGYGVADTIVQPFNHYVVMRRVKNAIDLYLSRNSMAHKLRKQAKELAVQAAKLKVTNDYLIETLSSVIEFRDVESGEHIRRIKYFTRVLLYYLSKNYEEYQMSLEDSDQIVQASAMHDIGKIGIADTILFKPGRLNELEFEAMKRHTIIGCQILDRFDRVSDKNFYDTCRDICRSHHERWDGKGYPDGLAGDEIPISAQIVSIADVYDALVSEHIYKTAYAHDEAFAMILRGECGEFNPKIMDCFTRSSEDFRRVQNTRRMSQTLAGNE